jgi:hypothetical protein
MIAIKVFLLTIEPEIVKCTNLDSVVTKWLTCSFIPQNFFGIKKIIYMPIVADFAEEYRTVAQPDLRKNLIDL